MKQTILCCVLGVLSAFAFSFFPNSVYAQSSEEITMAVGETKTLYLPYSVTSKTLKAITFYSNGISYVQVLSYNNYSVNVKAVKVSRINGKLMSVKTVLHRGDCVEIGTEENSCPDADWIDHVLTYKAKRHLRSFLSSASNIEYKRCPNCHLLPSVE